MRNNTILALLFISFLTAEVHAELEETTWLRSFLGSKGHSFYEVGVNFDQYKPELNDVRLTQIKSLINRVGSGTNDLEEADFQAAWAAVWLLIAANAPDIVQTVKPLMSIDNSPLKAVAAQAMATAGGDDAVTELETALRNQAKEVNLGDSQAPQEFTNYLRCLALIGSPKARAAFERGRDKVLAAQVGENETNRIRTRERIDAIWSQVEKTRELRKPSNGGTPEN